MTSKSYLTLALAGAAAVGWAALARADDKPILIGVTTAIQVQVGSAAVNKLTGEDHVDVLLGGYDSGVTLGELPHIARAKTIFLGIGSASPAIQAKVKDDYDHYKYIFRVNPINSAKQAKGLVDFIAGKLNSSLGYQKISIIGENAKWVQDIVPALKKGAEDAGITVPLAEFFDVQTADFSPMIEIF